MKAISAKIAVTLILIALLGPILGGCSSGKVYTKTRFLMDTKVDLVLYGLPAGQAESAAEEIFKEMGRLENVLSRYVPGSDVNRINAAAGRVPVEVQPETIAVVQKALEIARLSGGAFDPTVGPLLEVWGWGAGDPAVPAAQDIIDVLPLVGYQSVEIDVHRSTVFLPLPDMKMDLGGIAKGFIVDRGQALAKELSCSASYINAGGDINIEGRKPDGKDWRIAIQDPRDPQEWAAIIPLQGGSVATSGDYQRSFKENGEVFHHILDPHQGMPATGLRSATVVAPDAMAADALATAVFVLGRKDGLKLLESLDGIEGVVIDLGGEIHASSGLVSKIEIPSS
ncbi:MAG: FAD:protein FMN transferase [Firmicutes bacterium]|nr:FAD:protein FMN transferase [Bacillota bacterium]